MKKAFALAALVLSLASCTKPNQPVWVYEFTYKKYMILNDGDTVQGIKVKPDQFGNPTKELINYSGQLPSAQGWTTIPLNAEQLENVRWNLGKQDGGSKTLQSWKTRFAGRTLKEMMNFGDPYHDGYVIDPAYEDLTVEDLKAIVEVYEPGILIEHTTYKLSQRGETTRIREEMYSKKN